MTTVDLFQFKRGTSAWLTANNPHLEAGEKIVEIDTGRDKIGPQPTGGNWLDLPYTDEAAVAAAAVDASGKAAAAQDAAIAAAAVDATAKAGSAQSAAIAAAAVDATAKVAPKLNTADLDSAVAGKVSTPGSATDVSLKAAYEARMRGVLVSQLKADGTDESATFLAEYAALHAQGGGRWVLPSGQIRVDSFIDAPYTIDGTGRPKVAPIIIEGQGSYSYGSNGGETGAVEGSGTALDLRYAGTGHPAKWISRGFGKLTLRHLTITDLGTSDREFLRVTNTAIDIDSTVAFIGNPAKAGITCDQDAVVFGGTNQPSSPDYDTTDNGPFQGYGSQLTGAFFNRIRRFAKLQVYANNVVIRGNNVWNKCGSNDPVNGCALEITGTPSPQSSVGNVISDNLIEMNGYVYGMRIENALNNTFASNGFYDPSGATLACYRFEAHGRQNLIIGSFQGSVPLMSADTSQSGGINSNSVLSPLDMGTAFGVSVKVASNLRVVSNTTDSGGALVFQQSGVDRFQFYQPPGTNNLYLRDMVNGVNLIDVNPSAKVVNMNYLANFAAGVQRGYKAKTANYTILSTDDVIVFNGTSLVGTMPNAGSVSAGRVITVKNINASALTLNGFGGSQLIDGATSVSLAQWASRTLVSDGATNWLSV